MFILSLLIALLPRVSSLSGGGCSLLPGIIISDPSLSASVSSASPSDCCNKCMANQRCSAFSWSAGRCSLKAYISQTANSTSTTSGYVRTLSMSRAPYKFSLQRFQPNSSVFLIGSASLESTGVVLPVGNLGSGAMVFSNPVEILQFTSSPPTPRCHAASFATSFTFQITNGDRTSPPDGFAFVLSASNGGLTNIGQGYLGLSSGPYGDRTGALAIEFDTVEDPDYGDPDNSHVGINLNHSPYSVVTESTSTIGVDLNDKSIKYVWLDYDAVTNMLFVYLSTSNTKPDAYLLSYRVNLCRVLRPTSCWSCNFTRAAYFGFTASTSSLSQTMAVQSWSFSSYWPLFSPGILPLTDGGYSAVAGQNILDNDIRKLTGISSFEECMAECENENDCVAVVYGTPHQNYCWLKSDFGSVVSDANREIGLRLSGICFKVPGINLIGNNAVTVKNISGFSGCCDACTASSSCKFFTFSTSTRTCRLNSEISKVTNDSNIISGIRKTNPGNCTFLVGVSMDLSQSYYSSPVISQSDCCSLCSGDPSCLAFTFYPDSGLCSLGYVLSGLHADTFAISGLRQSEQSSYEDVPCMTTFGSEYKGNVLSVAVNVDIADDCNARCGYTEACKAYSFTSDNYVCTLLNNVSSLSSNPKAVAGMKETGSYLLLPGVACDIGGSEYYAYSDEECLSFCDSDPLCVAFTNEVQNYYDNYEYEQEVSVCVLHESVGSYQLYDRAVLGFKPNTHNFRANGDFELSGDMDYFGNDIYDVDSTFNPTYCGQLCNEDPSCVAFAVLSHCWIKNAVSPLSDHAGAVAGLKRQGDTLFAEKVPMNPPFAFSFSSLSPSAPFDIYGSANKLGSAIELNPDVSADDSIGYAFFRNPIVLLRDVSSRCQAASFSVLFSFLIVGIGAEGMTFNIFSSDVDIPSLLQGPGGGNLGFYLANNSAQIGGVAVEIDTFQTVGYGDLLTPHIGINVGFSAKSIISRKTSEIKVSLADEKVKYLWIDYDGISKMMKVYLSNAATKPSLPFISSGLDMCGIMRPMACASCQNRTAAYFAFGGTSSDYAFQSNNILSFQVNTSWTSIISNNSYQTGLFPVPNLIRAHQSPYLRYLSSGYLSQTTNKDLPATWLVALDWNWAARIKPSIKTQANCGSCYAMAVVAAIEYAYYLTNYSPNLQLPSLSSQQIVDCTIGKCLGGFPTDALEICATYGLLNGTKYPYKGVNGTCVRPQAAGPTYKINSYEVVSYGGWIGLLIAVQQQPVIVNIEGSSPSFAGYSGGILSDPNCYTGGVDHTVVIVGYSLRAEPPYWIIQNSWGPKWGEGGFIRLAITSGDGICGINTLPGYIPVFIKEAVDPCNTKSYASLTGLPAGAPGTLNPCGGGKCSVVNKTKVKCVCQTNFVALTRSDGNQICVYKSPCSLEDSNPCNVGTCIDSVTSPGTYACICPLGYTPGFTSFQGTLTCVPIAQNTNVLKTFTVPGDVAVYCSTLYELYGLSKAQFLVQNKNLNTSVCTKQLAANTVVNVSSTALSGCALPYSINVGDTCTSIQIMFKVPSLGGTNSLNPGLDCSQPLTPKRVVCIIRKKIGDFTPPSLPLCTDFLSLKSGMISCATLIRDYFRGNATLFFSLNVGMDCQNLLRNVGGYSNVTSLATPICAKASTFGSNLGNCRAHIYVIKSGDSCASIFKNCFNSARMLFAKYNSNVKCSANMLMTATNKKISAGSKICAPKKCKNEK